MVVVRLNSALDKYAFIDVYKVSKDYPLEMSMFGSANVLLNSTVLQVAHKFQTKLTRKDLHGVELRCALVVC